MNTEADRTRLFIIEAVDTTPIDTLAVSLLAQLFEAVMRLPMATLAFRVYVAALEAVAVTPMITEAPLL